MEITQIIIKYIRKLQVNRTINGSKSQTSPLKNMNKLKKKRKIRKKEKLTQT
jgi:hypothetical protein